MGLEEDAIYTNMKRKRLSIINKKETAKTLWDSYCIEKKKERRVSSMLKMTGQTWHVTHAQRKKKEVFLEFLFWSSDSIKRPEDRVVFLEIG